MLEKFLRKYPKTKHFLETTGMTLDQALIFTEIEIKKLERNIAEKHISMDKKNSD